MKSKSFTNSMAILKNAKACMKKIKIQDKRSLKIFQEK